MRKLLPIGYNSNNGHQGVYTIAKKMGEGASCFAYHEIDECTGFKCVIKEYFPTSIYPIGPTSPVLNKSEWQDFEELIATVELERPSIVVARHGVDFLTAWYLNTHVAAENVIIADVDNNYRSCYLL